MRIQQFILGAACAVLAAAPSSAGDFYVDAVLGSDANGGTSAIDAWRTITHALAAIPATPVEAHAIHLAPGVHGPALGEAFPLQMRPGLRLVGAGVGATALEGPASLLLQLEDIWGSGSGHFDSWSGAEHLTLRNADQGIDLWSNDSDTDPTFNDLAIEDMQVIGIRLTASSTPAHVLLDPHFSRVTVSGCQSGLELHLEQFTTLNNTATLTDCVIRDCVSNGIIVSGNGFRDGTLALSRTRVVGNGGNGVHYVATPGSIPQLSEGTFHLIAESSLFAENGGYGILGWAQMPTIQSTSVEIRNSTIAHNVGAGLVFAAGWSGWPEPVFDVSVWNSNLCGNVYDISIPTPFPGPFGGPFVTLEGHTSNSADGRLLGQPGCIAVNALFVDPSGGDYRLAFGSPCIDSADAAFMTSPDLLGQTRPFDGNLDTIALPDMGAMEFAPLYSTGFAPGSTRLLLELSGPSYGRSILYLSDTPLLKTPETTPFGSFFLVRSTAVQIPIARIQSPTSNLVELKVPAALVPGSTIALQALIRSSAAPAGAAFSNPLVFVIAP